VRPIGLTATAFLAFTVAACSPQPPAYPSPTPESTTAPVGAPRDLAPGRILYSQGGVDLWSSAPDGSGRQAVTHDGSAGGYLSAKWSPDGSLIAAQRAMPGENGSTLFVVRPDGSSRRLTAVDTFLDGYTWSPDGRYLAYGEVISGATAAAGGLTIVGAVGNVHLYDTRADVVMTVGPGTHPAFAPDGARLGYAHLSGAIAFADLSALASGTPDRFPTQFVVNLADLTRISTAIAPRGMGLIGGPQFSSDGKLIAYAAIENGPLLEAEQIVYVQEAVPGAPPKTYVVGKTGAVHHVADLRWAPVGQMLAYAIINAQPHHHWLYSINPQTGERRELFDSQQHFLDYSWSPDGKTILMQLDDGDTWLYFRPDHVGPVGSVKPGGWRPEWCRCSA
jgi:Tol biopolymer transport system component